MLCLNINKYWNVNKIKPGSDFGQYVYNYLRRHILSR